MDYNQAYIPSAIHILNETKDEIDYTLKRIRKSNRRTIIFSLAILAYGLYSSYNYNHIRKEVEQ